MGWDVQWGCWTEAAPTFAANSSGGTYVRVHGGWQFAVMSASRSLCPTNTQTDARCAAVLCFMHSHIHNTYGMFQWYVLARVRTIRVP